MASETKLDGYVNMLTKAGTWKDSTEAYVYRTEAPTPDAELAQIYSTNGLFTNGQLPRTSIVDSDYRFFGAPEYNRIKRELKDTVTTHGNGYRLLERCVQAVYKMKNWHHCLPQRTVRMMSSGGCSSLIWHVRSLTLWSLTVKGKSLSSKIFHCRE